VRAGGLTPSLSLTLSLPLILTLALALALILSLIRCVQEACVPKGTRGITLRQYGRKTWRMLQSRAMLAVILFNFLTPMVGYISTTSGGMVKNYWAGVKNLQNQLFSIAGSALFAAGLWLVKRYFLNYSWRTMLLTTLVLINLIDMPFVFLTVFGIVRNQHPNPSPNPSP
jgi:hypothetical protein